MITRGEVPCLDPIAMRFLPGVDAAAQRVDVAEAAGAQGFDGLGGAQAAGAVEHRKVAGG